MGYLYTVCRYIAVTGLIKSQMINMQAREMGGIVGARERKRRRNLGTQIMPGDAEKFGHTKMERRLKKVT